MPELALLIAVLYLVVAFGLKAVLLRRSTGTAGFRGITGRPGSAEWLGGVLFVVALVAAVVAPGLQAVDVLDPFTGSSALATLGLVVTMVGVVLTLWAQGSMGGSWRVGVDSGERTTLVTDGPFAVVRNPFFAALVPTAAGLVLMACNIVAVIALVALVAAIELQVRIVEEPYLRTAHADRYVAYARRVGRFFPGLGRLDAHGAARGHLGSSR